ncbi:MAG: hypothetical protein NC926_10550 [Candidatus Omnitrophica bacterium]|nr:hypothetical protein [Candidatus Omnitrophota bacterium]
MIQNFKIFKIEISAILFFVNFFSFSDVNFKIEIDQNLFKIKNYVKNPSFEEDYGWSVYSNEYVDGKSQAAKISEGTGRTEKEKYSGNYSFKITGKRNFNTGIYQRIDFEPPINKGKYLYLSYRIKTKGTIHEGGNIGISIKAFFTDGTNIYIPGLSIPKGIYNFEELKFKYEIPKDIKNIILYCIYYNQEGEIYYDDIFLTIIDKIKTKFEVSGKNLKRIRIYSGTDLIKDTENIKKGVNHYEDEIEILPLVDYLFEIEDYEGKIYRRTYPEKKVLIKEGEMNLTMGEERIDVNEEKIYYFNVKKKEDKKYIIELKCRLETLSKNAGIGGHNPALVIFINEERLKFDRVINRKDKFTMADGRICSTGNDVFTVYYSSHFIFPPEDNPYFPVDIPENDPYTYKFDITDILKDGENKVKIQNKSQLRALIIKDLKVIEK